MVKKLSVEENFLVSASVLSHPEKGIEMIGRKVIIFIVFMSICSIIVTGCSSSSTSNSTNDSVVKKDNINTVTLNVASYFAGNSPIYTAFTKPWMERVTELTEGKVQFEYYPDDKLGKSAELLNLTRDGVIDLSVFPFNYASDKMPLSNMLAGIPNLSETSHQGTLAYHELLQDNKDILATDFLKNGVRPVFTHVSPAYELWTTGKEVRVPKDLNGLIVRTPGGVANDLFEFIGATPLAVPLSETNEVLDKGVIDAISLYSMGLKNGSLEEILNYGVFPHLGTAIQGLIINENKWDSLPEDIQKAMIQAGHEVMENTGDIYVEETNKFNDDFVKNGKIIAELSDDELDQWKKVSEQFTKSWLNEHKSDGFPYNEVLNQYNEKLEKYK